MAGDVDVTVEVLDLKDFCDLHQVKTTNLNEGADMHLLSPGGFVHCQNSAGELFCLTPDHSYTRVHGFNTNHTVVFSEDDSMVDKIRIASTDNVAWRRPIHDFSSHKSSALRLKMDSLQRDVRMFYERQDELIEAYESTATESKLDIHLQRSNDPNAIVVRLSQISFFVNLMLMIAKAVAVGLSNSLSIISSLVDSIVDLISGIIIWWTTHTIKTSNIYVYPVGRTRLEPVAIIILSVIMSLASLEVMISSIRRILEFTRNHEEIAIFELPTLIIAASTVVIKFIMAISFYTLVKKKKMQLPAVDALIQDHSNDTISNMVAILCGYLGSKQFSDKVHTSDVAYIDPVGAIVIALYIIVSWFQTGSEQLRKITGLTADPAFLSKVTWISLNHSPKVLFIDTVRAFHFGSKFLVEVDIVLREDTVLSQSHDIGESLQQKLERMEEVERAFVHVDFDTKHNPRSEHIFRPK